MDPIIVPSMIFTFVMVLLIGGFILLFPITRRLGEAVEVWLLEHKKGGGSRSDLQALRGRLEELADRIEQIEDRQAFTEQLVEGRDPPALPHASDRAGGRH